MTEPRTTQQNKALHLYYKLVAEALNDAGLDMRKTLKEQIDIPWSMGTVKEYLWRPVQKILIQKESTTELDKGQEITRIYEVLNRHLGEKFGIYVPFPTSEQLKESDMLAGMKVDIRNTDQYPEYTGEVHFD